MPVFFTVIVEGYFISALKQKEKSEKKADQLSESGNKTSKHGRAVPQICDLVTFSAPLVRGKNSPKTPVENGRFSKNQQRKKNRMRGTRQ